MDLDAVRTFAAVADAGQFSEAAAGLSITQQAVSKRIADLAAAFGLSIDSRGPNFGLDPLLETIAGTPGLATFVGEQTHLSWPAGYGLRRIPLRDPVPVYPHALLWRPDNPHPALAVLRGHLRRTPITLPNASTWTPAWA